MPRRAAGALVGTLAWLAAAALAAPPGPPGTPSGTVEGLSVTLSWAAARDDEGVSGYNVYRDGRYLATVGGTRHVAELAEGRATAFYVTAFDTPSDGSPRGYSRPSPVALVGALGGGAPDAAGGEGKDGDTDGMVDATVDLPTEGADRAPGAASALVAAREPDATVRLSWNAASDDGGVVGYNVYRDARYLRTVTDTAFVDTAPAAGQGHDYFVVAFDEPRNFGPRSNVATVVPAGELPPDDMPRSVPDTRAPTTVAGLTSVVATPERISLVWDRSSDDTSVVGYNVYRDGAYLASVGGRTTYDDTRVPSAPDVRYQVVAFDAANNFSPYSDELVVTVEATDPSPGPEPTPDPDPDPGTDPGTDPEPGADPEPAPLPAQGPGPVPTSDLPAPTGLRTQLVANAYVQFQWQAVDGAVAYRVYRDGEPLYTVSPDNEGSQDLRYWTTTSYVDCDFTRYLICGEQAPEPGSRHVYTVSAVDAAGDESAGAAPLTVQLERNLALDVEETLADFELVVEDEFDGESLDHSLWNTRLPWGPDVTINRERQYFVDTKNEPEFGYDPFVLTGDTLQITGAETPPALSEAANGLPFLSGAITTRDAFNFTYGYVEARMKVAAGRGKLSSFFLFHQWNVLNAAEIDIAEYLGERPDAVSGNYHFRDERDGVTQHPSPTVFEENPGVPYHEDYHTYGVLWEPNLVVWTIDGEEFMRLSGPEISRQASYVILYLVLGSGWTESPDPTDADFAVPLEIDWLRVWQRPEFIR